MRRWACERVLSIRNLGLIPRGSWLVAGLWLLLGLVWAAAMLFAASSVAGVDGTGFLALMPAALLGPAIFGAAAWVELRQRPRRPGAHVELVAMEAGGVVAVVKRRRRANTPVRVALVARGTACDLLHVEWQHLPASQREVSLRFWAPPDLALAEGDRWQVIVIEDEPWGSRHRALDLGAPVRPAETPVGGALEA